MLLTAALVNGPMRNTTVEYNNIWLDLAITPRRNKRPLENIFFFQASATQCSGHY